MKYRIFAVLLVLCLLSGCKIELPSQHGSTATASSAGISANGETSFLPGLASGESQPLEGGSSSGGTSAVSGSNSSSKKSSVVSPSKSAPFKPTSSNQASSVASRAPSSAAASAAPAPAKQTVLTFSITCKSILENKDRFDPAKLTAVPANGVILPETQVDYTPGESVLDVLQRVAQEKDIVLNVDSNNALGTAYVSRIGNISEKDFGTQSGWTYAVNNTSPGVGAAGYKLKKDTSYRIEWKYVC